MFVEKRNPSNTKSTHKYNWEKSNYDIYCFKNYPNSQISLYEIK